jgi:membrane protease YdiL (CAAX protease family)
MMYMDWKTIPWGPADIVLYFVLLALAFGFLVLSVNLVTITGLFITVLELLQIPSINPLVVVVSVALVQAAIMVALVLLVCFVKNGGTWADLGLGGTKTSPWRTGILSGFGLLIISLAYGFIAGHLAGEIPAQGIIERMGEFRGLPGIISLGLVVVVLAPLSEELVFRGFVFGALRKRGGFLLAGSISSLAFTIIHLQFHPVLFLQLLILGFLLAWAYERTGNLAVPILAHAVYNLAIAAIILSSG